MLARQRLLPLLELAPFQLPCLSFARRALRLFAAQGLLPVLRLASFGLALLRRALFLLAPDRLLALQGLVALADAALLGFGLAALVVACQAFTGPVGLRLCCLLPRLRLGCVLALLRDLLAARSAFLAIAVALRVLGGRGQGAGCQQQRQPRAEQWLDAEVHVKVPRSSTEAKYAAGRLNRP
ncbi:MAG TPA: hypothetical protein VFX93_03680 [Xanthomonadaceae bacterium]|nr:hypothetical protein [Xanthomonadaceae bacterium]